MAQQVSFDALLFQAAKSRWKTLLFLPPLLSFFIKGMNVKLGWTKVKGEVLECGEEEDGVDESDEKYKVLQKSLPFLREKHVVKYRYEYDSNVIEHTQRRNNVEMMVIRLFGYRDPKKGDAVVVRVNPLLPKQSVFFPLPFVLYHFKLLRLHDPYLGTQVSPIKS